MDAPCGGTRPTSCSAMHGCPPPAACASAVQACARPVSTATRAPVAAARRASTCAVHRPPMRVTSYGTGRLMPSTAGRFSASTPITMPSSPTGRDSASSWSRGTECRSRRGPTSPKPNRGFAARPVPREVPREADRPEVPGAPERAGVPKEEDEEEWDISAHPQRKRRQDAGHLFTVESHKARPHPARGALQFVPRGDQFLVAAPGDPYMSGHRDLLPVPAAQRQTERRRERGQRGQQRHQLGHRGPRAALAAQLGPAAHPVRRVPHGRPPARSARSPGCGAPAPAPGPPALSPSGSRRSRWRAPRSAPAPSARSPGTRRPRSRLANWSAARTTHFCAPAMPPPRAATASGQSSGSSLSAIQVIRTAGEPVWAWSGP